MVAHEAQNRTSESPTGDPCAFEAVVREHQRMIHSLCYRMTGSLADADDLAQETFIQAFQHLASFRGQSRMSSWLYRIAMNRCLNWQNSRVRKEQLHLQWSELELEQGSAGEGTGHGQQVQEALMKLDPKQRAAVLLTVFDGLTHGEAARILGCSETTISWRVFAARRKLKRLLKDLQPRGGAK